MTITKPDYYDRFRCIASACPDSCCKEWDVQVDAQTAARYGALTGELGDRLRRVLRDEDGETVMTIVDGRCPMWREDGLCRIQAELGEQALCHVCREFPRLRHEYGDFTELGLELSCPEAARMILAGIPAMVTEQAPGGEAPEYDAEAMAVLRVTRAEALSILTDASLTPTRALAALLIYGYGAQEMLDGGESAPFDAEAALEEARTLAKEGSLAEVTAFFEGLEILTDDWRERLRTPAPAPMGEQTRALAAYLINRYWLQAVSDYDLVCRVKFTVISCLLVSALGGDFVQTAQLFSKEIENDADNVDALLDGAYTCPAFTDDRLLGLLLA